MSDDAIKRFMTLGLTEQKARETLKNAAVTKNLNAVMDAVNGTFPEGSGTLLYHLATKIKSQIIDHLGFVATNIASKKLDTQQRVDAALEYLLSNTTKKIDVSAFEKACGVGIVVTPEEIEAEVEKELSAIKSDLISQRYRFNVGKVLQEVRRKLPWADGKAIKNEVDVQVFDILGPKTEADTAPLPKVEKKPKEVKKEVAKTVESSKTTDDTSDSANSIAELMKNKVHFHAPGENFKTDGYVVTPNTERLLAEHLKLTKGQVRTRFPPEPNGILHIGHAKAININFGYAAAHNGICFLRYDDTNPEKEEERFFEGIRDIVEWLGYKPYQITHSSDHFQQLYDWAMQLIKSGNAYVCHQTADEMKGHNPPPSPWRDRPIEESVILFEDMKNGKIEEGTATLRMKVTLEEGKQDPVAYRIKFIEHPRTDQWCIYPTYDYTHCLCDSLENITHSLCTKEFQSRRSSYYWLCNALNIYCPVQWEFGRLNVNYALTSKRKIAKLIDEKIVHDWDDPRLFTLAGLRRRGIPPEAINNFCAQMGVTGAQSAVDPMYLDAAVRDVLNVTAPRVLVVLEPLKVTIKNFHHPHGIDLEVPNFPNNPEKGTTKIHFDQIVYIEATDFKETPEKGYRRLAPDQTVGLRHTGMVIKVEQVLKDESGTVKELICSCENAETAAKPKAFIQWVSKPLAVEVRLYERLFLHKNPSDPNEVPGGFLTDCNPNSLKAVEAYADQSLKNVKPYDRFQFERIGFFTVDEDSKPGNITFNRTVTLKEDAGKN